MGKEGADIQWYVCDAGHVHLSFVDSRGNELFGIAIDINGWFELTDEIDTDIDVMLSAEESKEAVKH